MYKQMLDVFVVRKRDNIQTNDYRIIQLKKEQEYIWITKSRKEKENT